MIGRRMVGVVMVAARVAHATPEGTTPRDAPAAEPAAPPDEVAPPDDAMSGDIVTDATQTPNVVEREAVAEHRLGIAAYKAGKFDEARAHYQRSLSLLPHYQTAALLGQVEAALGHHTQAAECFSLSLSLVPQGEDSSRPQAALTEAKQHVHTLNVVAHVYPDLTITLDGSPLAKPRPRGDGVIELFLVPGSHDVSFDKPGFATQRHTVEGSAGTTLVLHVSLIPLPESANEVAGNSSSLAVSESPHARTALTPDRPLPETHLEHYWPVYVGGVATLAAAGMGTYLSVKAHRSDRALGRLEQSNSGEIDQCSTALQPLPEACLALRERAEARDGQYRWSMVGFVTAGVLGAATVGALVWLVNTDTETQVTPSISAQHLGVVVEHRF